MKAAKKFPKHPRASITGASSGFGRAIALRLAERGARLVLSDIDEEELELTAARARDRGAEVRTIGCDVRDPEQVEAQALLADNVFGGDRHRDQQRRGRGRGTGR